MRKGLHLSLTHELCGIDRLPTAIDSVREGDLHAIDERRGRIELAHEPLARTARVGFADDILRLADVVEALDRDAQDANAVTLGTVQAATVFPKLVPRLTLTTTLA